MSDVYALLDELAAAFLRGGYTEEAAKVKQHRADLSTGSQLDRIAAVEAISACCHVKSWGDLNLDVVGPGTDPVLSFLAKLKAAAMQEVGMTSNSVFKGRRAKPARL